VPVPEGRENEAVRGRETKSNYRYKIFFFFLAEGEIHSLQNNTCWVIKIQLRLMLSGAVVVYRVSARIQCWQRVLLFPVFAGFALVNMPFESA